MRFLEDRLYKKIDLQDFLVTKSSDLLQITHTDICS